MKVSAQSIKALVKPISIVVKKNAPQILSGLGIAFGIGAIGFTAKGTVDLMAPGYVYTEIEPRRWIYGEGDR